MARTHPPKLQLPIRSRQRLGKYVIESKLGEGGFATVYRARDTIEGRRVALKIPHPHLMTDEALEEFRREVRMAAKLDHPHVLPLKNADFIDGYFVIANALGDMTLGERMQRRMKVTTAIEYVRQAIESVAYAHRERIIHCDIKPDNFLIFANQHLRLTDFGIARIAQRTLRGSGTGTVGYVAPEQAMGKPSFRSDVFSLGLVFYRLLAGQLPEWPYEWPGPGIATLESRVHPKLIGLLRKSIQVDARLRFADARQMLEAFQQIQQPVVPRKNASSRRKTRQPSVRRASSASPNGSASHPPSTSSPHASRRQRQRPKRSDSSPPNKRRPGGPSDFQMFQDKFGQTLATHHHCSTCQGPLAESMKWCPWCGEDHRTFQEQSEFPVYCPRCQRGMQLDWCACPWCHGESFAPWTDDKINHPDYHASARCANPRCQRKHLMPFMTYCPWCRTRVKKKWKIAGSTAKCARCEWGVLPQHWKHCPWCRKRIP